MDERLCIWLDDCGYMATLTISPLLREAHPLTHSRMQSNNTLHHANVVFVRVVETCASQYDQNRRAASRWDIGFTTLDEMERPHVTEQKRK